MYSLKSESKSYFVSSLNSVIGENENEVHSIKNLVSSLKMSTNQSLVKIHQEKIVIVQNQSDFGRDNDDD